MATINDLLFSGASNVGQLGQAAPWNGDYASLRGQQWQMTPGGTINTGMTRGDDPSGLTSQYVNTPWGQMYDQGGGQYTTLAGGGDWASNPYNLTVDENGVVSNVQKGDSFRTAVGQQAATVAALGGAAYGGAALSGAGGSGAGAAGGMSVNSTGTTLSALEGANGIGYGSAAAGGASAAVPASAAASTLGGSGAMGSIGSALTSPAGIGTIASLLGGYQQSQAADRAAQAQLDAARMQTDEIRRQYDQNRADQMPWMEAGKTSLADLMGRMPDLTSKYDPSQLQNDPGYQFGLNQGASAISAKQKALGLGNSGATLKALTQYGQDYAGTKYNEAFNRDQVQKNSIYNMLAGISGTGQTTANQIGSSGANASNSIANIMSQAGNASAAGTVGAANAWTNTANNIGNLWQNQNMMDMYSNMYGKR